MSLHSSLKIDTAGAQQRSVLSRIERMKDLMKKGLWKEGRLAVGLPKTKVTKLKARKAGKEAKPAEGAAGAAASPAPIGNAAAPAAKTGAPAAKAAPKKQ